MSATWLQQATPQSGGPTRNSMQSLSPPRTPFVVSKPGEVLDDADEVKEDYLNITPKDK